MANENYSEEDSSGIPDAILKSLTTI